MGNVRDYAALPHEYLEEMAALSDAEFGRLVRALLTYSMDRTPIALNGNERFYAVRVMNREDRYQQAFQDANSARSRAGAAGASARWGKANACEGMQTHANACEGIEEDAANGNTETKANAKTETEPKKESKHAHGEYGWVKLTDAQYEKLLADLGQEELDRCIRYVDESAQKTKNKNHWSDWNLVIRNCHRDGWGQKPAGKKRQYSTAEEYAAAAAKTTPLEPDAIWGLVDRI